MLIICTVQLLMSVLNGPIEIKRKANKMRITIVLLIVFSALNNAQAQQSSSCKQCSDQRHACAGGYSAKTCQVEYDRCMKNCKGK